MNEFQKRYKSFENHKLLKIIEEAEKYQPIAVEAAQLELSRREISDEEIQRVKDKVEGKKAVTEQRQNQVKKVKAKGTELFDIIKPIQENPPTIDRKINLIVIVFGLMALYRIYQQFDMIQLILTSNLAEWEISLVLFFLPMILLPIGVFHFWKRNKVGWILMSIFFVYNFVNGVVFFLMTWEWKKEEKYSRNDYSDGEFLIMDYEDHENYIDHFFPETNSYIYVLIIAVYGATLWYICKEDIRKEFQVEEKSALITIGISVLITSIFIGLL